MKPFLKWAGGKYKLTAEINDLLPMGKRLVEPFVGSGSVFLNSNFDDFLLCDINEDLINLYNELKHDKCFIDECYAYFIDDKYNDKESYLRLRDEFNHLTLQNKLIRAQIELKKFEEKKMVPEHRVLILEHEIQTYGLELKKNIRKKSLLFVYFNRYGFNGLCRYNREGMFNVPFGDGEKPYFPQKEMEFFHDKSKKAMFVVGDFTYSMGKAKQGDVFYCDPPYAPLPEQKTNFTTYAANQFGDLEQEKLAKIAFGLLGKEIPVLISNHDTEDTRQWYQISKNPDVHERTLSVQRNISSKGSERGKAKELLVLFYKK